MEPIYADPEKSRLKGPFRIYENFRNVYKGVRKNASNKGSYAFDGGGGIVHGHHASRGREACQELSEAACSRSYWYCRQASGKSGAGCPHV